MLATYTKCACSYHINRQVSWLWLHFCCKGQSCMFKTEQVQAGGDKYFYGYQRAFLANHLSVWVQVVERWYCHFWKVLNHCWSLFQIKLCVSKTVSLPARGKSTHSIITCTAHCHLYHWYHSSPSHSHWGHCSGHKYLKCQCNMAVEHFRSSSLLLQHHHCDLSS